jgi:nitronate monooxygenase
MQDGLSTRFCSQYGIRYPIVQAPMAGGWTTPELVAAVTNAGGLGSLPATRLSVDALRDAIAKIRSATHGPFAVNFLVGPPDDAPADVNAMQLVLDEVRAELGLPPGPRALRLPPSVIAEQLGVALEAGVPVISFAMGCPSPLIQAAHSAGARVFVMVTTVDEAIEAERFGADVVVAQGIEAGGHRSTFQIGLDKDLPQVGTLALVPQVVDAVSVPVIATGGIMDGRGIVAALALGASAAQLGTRFLLTTESAAVPAYRAWIASRSETSTRITRLLTGRPARAFQSRLLDRLEASGLDALPWPYQAFAADDIYRAAIQRGDAEYMSLLAGQGLRLSQGEVGAAQLVESLVQEANAVLGRFAPMETTASLPS